MNSPILLSSGRTTFSKNQVLEPDSTRMQNPFRTAMLIDEIRFWTNWASSDVAFGPFLSLRAELKLGRNYLTRGFVPISCLGKVILEQVVSPDSPSPDNIRTRFTWKLPKPLYIPATELLVARLMYDGRYDSSNGNGPSTPQGEVTFAGRSLGSSNPRPKKITIPWVTHFDIPTLAYVGGNSDETVSDQSQIVNPYNEPLRVQRFIGRTTLINENQHPNSELGGIAGSVAPFTQTTVRAVDSLGNILVRDPTPFAHLFQYVDRAWTVNALLPPKGFYNFVVNRDYTTADGAPATDVGIAFAHAISMVGYREVELQ